MERFEPTQHHSSSSTSSLEYGFAASVVTPSSTPSHHSQHQISPAPSQTFQGAAATAPTGAAPYNHVYSYAYYEPGAAKCHTNIPPKEEAAAIMPAPAAQAAGATAAAAGPSKSPTRNSIRALLARSFRSKPKNPPSTSSSPSGAEERHNYTTRYGTTENLYEEVNDQKIRKVLSDNRIVKSNVIEEIRRVQHNHFRVLDELNLSLEALIMPETPPDVSPNAEVAEVPGASASPAAVLATPTSTAQKPRRGGLLGGAASTSSSTVSSSQPRTLSHASLENLSSTFNSIELKDHAHLSCINPEFDEGDLDSGFSGSGSSSGASYNESLRYYKSGHTPNHHPHHTMHHHQVQLHNHQVQLHPSQQHQLQQQQQPHPHLHQQPQQQHPTTLPHNMRSCRSSTASGSSTSKSSTVSSEDQGIAMMTSLGSCGTAVTSPASPFHYNRCCADIQRASARSASDSSATGAKPKKNFWKIKP